jgi:hypothetical protein
MTTPQPKPEPAPTPEPPETDDPEPVPGDPQPSPDEQIRDPPVFSPIAENRPGPPGNLASWSTADASGRVMQDFTGWSPGPPFLPAHPERDSMDEIVFDEKETAK